MYNYDNQQNNNEQNYYQQYGASQNGNPPQIIINQQAPVSNVKPTSGLAVASLVLGIIALLTICTLVVSVICSILAIVFGCAANTREKAGKGMAYAGAICGLIALFPAIYIYSAGISILSSL